MPHDVRQINRLWPFGEPIPTVEVHMLPCDGRNLFERLCAGRIAAGLFMGQEFGENGGVKVDNAVSEQAAALIPNLLLLFTPKAQFAEVRIGDGPA